MRKQFVLVAVALLWSLSATAQSVEKGESICYQVQRSMNAMVDYTDTSCLPASGKAGALSFVVLSSQPVLSVASLEAAKKAWLLAVVAVVGKNLNDHPSIKTDELWLSDASLMKNRIAYVFPTSLAKSLQHQVYNAQIDLEEMYAAIEKNLVRRQLPKK
jgi:hypothetical protein